MSKIYEALQHAYRQKTGGESTTTPHLPIPFAAPVAGDTDMGEEMLKLYKVIDVLLPGVKSKVIQFIGTREGEGTSTIVREFARVCADMIGNTVLLLDADRHQPTQRHYFNIQNEYGWIEALKNGEEIGDAFYRVGQSKLFMSPSCNSAVYTPEMFHSLRFDCLWRNLRDDFDLILIDSAPLTISPDGLAIASKVDGIIMVVEAEKTKRQTLEMARDNITRVGGKILGVAFNKRRYYIPQALYKFL